MMHWAKDHPIMSFFLALAGLGTAVTIGREVTNPGITMKQANAALPPAATPAQVAATPATTVAAGLVHKVGKWPHPFRVF
jgi:hypothetical protein